MKLRHYIVAPLFVVVGVVVWVALAYLTQPAEADTYSLIEERLYVGPAVASPPPGTTAVVNLCQQQDRYQVDAHLWEPIDGSQAPDIDWMRRVVAFIDTQRRDGKTVYVHCLAGMNRSGMVVTAYLMHEHGWTRDEALVFAQSKRPQIQPNPTLMRFLADWETSLKQR